MLQIKDLRVNYGGVAAVQGVSLEIADGEMVALVGANGAGKTSTLMAIAGVVKPAGGSIDFDGVSLVRRTPEWIVANGVSMVPEGRRILASLTVRENLQLAAIVRKDRVAAAADINKMLERFPVLGDRYNGLAGMLSGGEQQQLAFARALVASPKLLLCDEPSLGLSPMMTDQVFETLASLREDGLTILLVEQFAQRALQMADRAYVMTKGQFVLEKASGEALTDEAMKAAYFGVEQ